MHVVLVRVQLLPPHEAQGVVIEVPGVGGQRRLLGVATPAANTGCIRKSRQLLVGY